LASNYQVHAVTDITGYGLLGHAHEMAHLSGVGLEIDYPLLRWLPGAQSYGEQDIFPGGMGRNRDFYNQWVSFAASLKPYEQNLLYDPQTSGGLLIALRPEDAQALCDQLVGESAAIIGEVQPGGGEIRVRGL
jgi:selenide,water dikinase